MIISVVQDTKTFKIEIPNEMELENLQALIEAETGIEPQNQRLLFNSYENKSVEIGFGAGSSGGSFGGVTELSTNPTSHSKVDAKKTLKELGIVGEDVVVVLERFDMKPNYSNIGLGSGSQIMGNKRTASYNNNVYSSSNPFVKGGASGYNTTGSGEMYGGLNYGYPPGHGHNTGGDAKANQDNPVNSITKFFMEKIPKMTKRQNTEEVHKSTSTNKSTQVLPTGEIETMRRKILQDKSFSNSIAQDNPELVAAAKSDPKKFEELVKTIQQNRYNQELQSAMEQERLHMLLNDPLNVEAQRRIEKAIQMENVQRSMEDALEHNPESFARVTMLYINVEVNGHRIKAFVDSGAQVTIMSPECAEKCGLMRLLDDRFHGVAMGVGTAKILGRIHNATIKLGKKKQHLLCSFTVMEGMTEANANPNINANVGQHSTKQVEMLFGLDMLRRYLAIIDLKKNALIINDEEIPFLHEYEMAATSSEPSRPQESVQSSTSQKSREQETLIPSSSAPPVLSPNSNYNKGKYREKYDEELITRLMSLAGTHISTNTDNGVNPDINTGAGAGVGVGASVGMGGNMYKNNTEQNNGNGGFSRDQVVRALDMANGDADLAASILLSFD